MKENSIKKVIELVNSGKPYPALSLVDSNPEIAALISKLVKGNTPKRFDSRDESSAYELNQGRLAEISSSIDRRIGDAENMMQLFPDLELAAQILVSSILSPKDMINVSLIYKTSRNVFPSEVTMKLTDIIKRECESYYKVISDLPIILKDILFYTGSYIRAIIPESSLDELINSSGEIAVESLNPIVTQDNRIRSLGILGSGLRDKTPITNDSVSKLNVGLESFQVYNSGKVSQIDTSLPDLSLDIVDNYEFLKMPKLIEANNRNKLKRIIRSRSTGFSMESSRLSSKEFESIIYKNSQGKSRIFAAVKTQETTKRKSIGRPLILHLPSESTIPVHVPGDPRSAIGYFVIVDEEGNPQTRSANMRYIQDLQSRITDGSHTLTSMLLEKARANLRGNDRRPLNIDQAARIYSGIVESELIERLRNGVYGSKIAVGGSEEVYRIMLARTLSNQFTRLVYIPQELVSYYAYKYYDNGVGKSLLDDLSIMFSLRGILLFAKVMALTKNSIALTHVNMTLDPNDPDPQKTIEMSIHEIIKMRQQYFPLGINSPVDLIDWIQRVGFEFSFEGHPGIPQTKFDFETKNMQNQIPDNDLDELLRKQTIMYLGLSPETIDNGWSPEFATTVVSNNILLSKRVYQIQEQIAPHLTNDVRRLVRNDAVITDMLLEALKSEKGRYEQYLTDEDKNAMNTDPDGFYDYILNEFIDALEIEFSKPDITTLENQSTAYNNYSEALDKAMESWISNEFITNETAGDIGTNVDMIKGVYKSYFLRKWMSENGYMNELNEIVSTNEDGGPSVELLDVMKNHIEGITRGTVKFLESIQAMRNAANKDLNNMNVEIEPGTNEGETSGYTEETGEGSESTEETGEDLME